MLDEWNHDGYMIIGEILSAHSVPACTGVIEQVQISKAPMKKVIGVISWEIRPTWHLLWVDKRYGTKPIPVEGRRINSG